MKHVFGLAALALFTAGPVRLQDPQPRPLGTLVDVGGYRVHLFCTGTGSPTVVVTGAGASFDWGLVQPEVAKFTRVCTYDHSGVAWSDPGPRDTCSLRVNEIRAALSNSGTIGPYVLVGHSLGAFVSRLYAAKFETEVVGMVIVDHGSSKPLAFPTLVKVGPTTPQRGLIVPEHDPQQATIRAQSKSFEKLPEKYYKLHVWADSLPATPGIMSRNVQLAAECGADVTSATKDRPAPLGGRPFIAVSTAVSEQMHSTLLGLSTNSKQITAADSGHYIMIDRPDVVVEAIREVVRAAKTGRALAK